MPDHDFAPLSRAQIDWQDDIPIAADFADPYFCRENGIAETDHVFIAGNQLEQRFRELYPGALFVIGETGFGTGLSFFRAAECFLKHAPADARLHFISAEKHPLERGDLQHALKQWPHHPLLRDALLQHWPASTPGFHHRELLPNRLTLTLLYGDCVAMLRLLNARVDAWFLDGFAPARNADMWRPELFTQMQRLSQPGATVATFTAAGFVRRDLGDAGFVMQRVPGYGRKREMLCGFLGNNFWRANTVQQPTAIVIGAGLAGATVARSLARQGIRVRVIDCGEIAGAASGNLAGVLYTTPSAHPTPQNRFYQSSYLHALHWLQRESFPNSPEHGALCGVLQYPKDERLANKARDALNSGLWPSEELQALEQNGAMRFVRGGYLSPPHWCRHLLDHPLISLHQQHVDRLQYHNQRWQVVSAQSVIGEADHVVLANSFDALRLAPVADVRLKKIRGQVSYVRATAASRRWQEAICHAGYLTPSIDDLHCVGATFDLHDHSPAEKDDDDHANLEELRQYLPKLWQQLGGEQAQIISRRVGFRCQSTDFLPLAGAVPEQPAGLWMSIAHGSRGLSGTPLCADLLSAQILGLPTPVDQEIIDALAPGRFMLRQNQRLRGKHQ
ncbi:MAG: bifunctional tRNA (5-methylaminomethyl-2-thiouridine)(34)-methyltransferase MnmD/FAD-dependent 5-carboxymethylaminomethyl-2-thiouridine(34) oxidoreductase MnmC [Alcanivoracaceae bacterium]|nr:bifunctional tRNA (5-methylaminomethyl-2-thiouridine)(34)-methyltransferase MnmD/FAD-dependent 5-carboxymethylaminomethyl-2-thiouridine(34) oxidoreductase MnmC [Alcanivoracaceae bacterium]